jgi:hypothetical protein
VSDGAGAGGSIINYHVTLIKSPQGTAAAGAWESLLSCLEGSDQQPFSKKYSSWSGPEQIPPGTGCSPLPKIFPPGTGAQLPPQPGRGWLGQGGGPADLYPPVAVCRLAA